MAELKHQVKLVAAFYNNKTVRFCYMVAALFQSAVAFKNSEMILRVVSRQMFIQHHVLGRASHATSILSMRKSSTSKCVAASALEDDEKQTAALLDPYDILRDQNLDKIPLPNKLSPTSLESFTKCHQAFFFQYILKIKPDPPMTPELARGIICHKALEDVYELAPQQRTLDNLQNLFRKEWGTLRGDRESNTVLSQLSQEKGYNAESYDSLFRSEINDGAPDGGSVFDINAEIDWGRYSLQLLKNYYELEDPRKVTPIMREMWVNAKFPTDTDSFVVHGKIDRIDLVSPNGNDALLRILDYKTGKKPHFKYSTSTNERIANEQFWKMKVYALMLWKMIVHTEGLEQKQDSTVAGKTDGYKFGLSWEFRQKLLQNLGFEKGEHPKWSDLLTLESLRLTYLTSHLDDMAVNYNASPDAQIGKAKNLDLSLNGSLIEFMSVLDQTEREVLSIQKQIKELVDLQDPHAWHHCNWKYCNCHEMRRRFKSGTVSDKFM